MNRKIWKLSNGQYEYIKGEVIHLFVKYKVKCIPISGFEIASKMKITLIAYSGLSRKKLRAAMKVSEDGFHVFDGGKEIIYYNDIDKCYERQNMTILHEIGHIVLDHEGHSEWEEDEANFFAKYAIAPPVLVDKIKPRSSFDIYDWFDISFQAACYAYRYYRKWKCRHDNTGRYTDYEIKLLNLYEQTIIEI